MSNILIIKHGSLGDIAQASGVIQDIYENHKGDNIYILTTKPYLELLNKNPFINEVILDKRLSRFNLIYLFFLMKKIKSFKFKKVYDLQNSSRTEFYKRILYPNAKNNIWSSSITTLPDNISKEDFDKTPVLERFNHQLKNSGLDTNHTLSPSFEWACEEIDEIKKNYNLNKYILLLPFCSPHLASKKWPYYNELIKIILNKFNNKYKIIIAPGPSEISQSKDFNATCVLDKNKAISISKLATLIKDCEFVVANDTGPAHMSAHLGVSGLALFGKHTTAHKVSIERKNFKTIQVNDLQKLSPEKVFDKMREVLR